MNEVGTIHDIVRTLVVAAIITLIVILVLTIVSPGAYGNIVNGNILITGKVVLDWSNELISEGKQ